MDPWSLIVGAMAGACIAVGVMAFFGGSRDDPVPPEEDSPDQGPLILPDDRKLH